MIGAVTKSRRAQLGLLAAILVLPGCGPRSLPAEAYIYRVFPRELLHDGGVQALNIVIVGDGFTADAASLGAYRTAAAAFVTNLLAAPPFGAMKDAFSVYRVDVPSAEAGIDVPDRCGSYVYANPPAGLEPWARTPRERNTALGTTFCADGFAPYSHFIMSEDEQQVWDAAFSAGVFPHLVVVLVNDWMYGAAAWPQKMGANGSGGIVYVSIGQNLTNELNPQTSAVLQPQDPAAYPAVAVHEIGHLGPFELLDEYGNLPGPIPADVQAEIDDSPNLTSTLAPLKWETLKTPGSILPTDCSQSPTPEAAAAPRGARYASGVFHARCDCRMNQYWSDSFCVVCRQQFLTQLTPFAPPSPPNWKIRLLVDSVLLEQGAAGHFFITTKLGAGNSSITGRWPSRVQNQSLTPGQIEEVSEVLLDVPPSFSLPLRLEYSFLRASTSTGSTGTLVERRIVSLPTVRGRGVRMEQFDFTTHRITIGVIVR